MAILCKMALSSVARSLALCLIVAVSICSSNHLLPSECGKRGLADRVAGGHDAVLFGWPWIALLEAIGANGRRSLVCGGVLISDLYILTAAHCVHSSSGYKLVRVRLGEHRLSTNPDCIGSVCAHRYQRIRVQEIIIHEDYNKVDGCRDCNDIALVRLKRKVQFNRVRVNGQSVVLNVQPICLPQNLQRDLGFSQNEFQSKLAWTAGWGTTDHGTGSNVLQQIQLKINSSACPYTSTTFPDPNMVLCVEENGKGTCYGDSGGPLVLHNDEARYYVIGIVTGGASHCSAAHAGGRYINVNHYVPWIIGKLRA